MNIAKKHPQEIITHGMNELRAFVRDRLETFRANLESDVAEHEGRLAAAVESAPELSSLIEKADYLFVKDCAVSENRIRNGTVIVHADSRVLLQESNRAPMLPSDRERRYRLVVAFVPIDEQ